MYLSTYTHPNNPITGHLKSSTRLCMGTLARIEVTHPDEHIAESVLNGIEIRLQNIESSLSRFIKDSLVSQINRNGYRQEILLDQNIFSLFEICQDVFIQTEGIFDITVAPLMDLWRKSSVLNKIPDTHDIETAKSAVGFENIKLNTERKSIRLLHPETGIDFGGIGKGFALDRISSYLADSDAEVFVNLGGNIFYKGNYPIQIAVRNPLNEEKTCGNFKMNKAAVSTSSNSESDLMIKGKTYSHIMDLKGKSDDRLLSVTVAADSAALADAFSTSFYMMSKDRITDFVSRFDINTTACVYRKKSGFFKDSVRVEYI